MPKRTITAPNDLGAHLLADLAADAAEQANVALGLATAIVKIRVEHPGVASVPARVDVILAAETFEAVARLLRRVV